jgi:hypothetical protein
MYGNKQTPSQERATKMSSINKIKTNAVEQLDWLNDHFGHYHSYDHYTSMSNGSHAVLRADVNYLLDIVDNMTWAEQQAVLNGKTSDDFQQILETIHSASVDMHVTVMEANVRLLITDKIMAWATSPAA